MKDEPKKPDLRDTISAPPTTVSGSDRKFADEPLNSGGPSTVKPGPEVQTPGQTTKQ